MKKRRSSTRREAEGADGFESETDDKWVTKQQQTTALCPAAVLSHVEALCPLFVVAPVFSVRSFSLSLNLLLL